MGDLILFPARNRRAVREEELPCAAGAAVHAARADRDDEWLDRLSTAIALGPSWDPGDGPLCDVVPIRSR